MNARIVIDPKLYQGKPVIKGTRTPVTVILSALANGDTFEKIQSDHGVAAEDIRAALAYTADVIDHGNGSEAPDSGCFRNIAAPKPLSTKDKKALRGLLTDEQFDSLMDVASSGGPNVEAIARIRAQSMT